MTYIQDKIMSNVVPKQAEECVCYSVMRRRENKPLYVTNARQYNEQCRIVRLGRKRQYCGKL